MLRYLATKPPSVVMGHDVRRDAIEGLRPMHTTSHQPNTTPRLRTLSPRRPCERRDPYAVLSQLKDDVAISRYQTTVGGYGSRRSPRRHRGVAPDAYNFPPAKHNAPPSHPLSTSSLRTPGPIRRAVAVERRCCDISPPNHRRWLWVTTFAATPSRGCARCIQLPTSQTQRPAFAPSLHVVPANAGTHTPCRRS